MSTSSLATLAAGSTRISLCAMGLYLFGLYFGFGQETENAVLIQGEVVGEDLFLMGKSNHEPYRYKFEALVSGIKWKITTIPAHTNSSVKYELVSYDGTNMYWYQQYADYPTNVANSSMGSIAECKKPAMLGRCDALLPWFATACNGYFDTEEPGVAKDIWTIGDPDARTNKNKIVIRRNPNPPHLPEYIEFYTDGILRSIEVQSHKVIRRPYPEPYNQGFITRIYYATNFLNEMGLWFPREFELHTIRINLSKLEKTPRETNVFELTQIRRGKITGTGVLKATGDEFIPRIDGKTYTVDGRFANPGLGIRGITYVNTNQGGLWLDKESKTLKRLYEHEVNLRQTLNRKPWISGGPRVILFLAFILVALSPLIGWMLKKDRPKDL